MVLCVLIAIDCKHLAETSQVPQLYCIHYQNRGWGPWLGRDTLYDRTNSKPCWTTSFVQHCIVSILHDFALFCIALVWSESHLHICIARHWLCTLQNPQLLKIGLEEPICESEQLRSLLSLHRKFFRSDLNPLLAFKTKILFRGRGEVIESLRQEFFFFNFQNVNWKLENFLAKVLLLNKKCDRPRC